LFGSCCEADVVLLNTAKAEARAKAVVVVVVVLTPTDWMVTWMGAESKLLFSLVYFDSPRSSKLLPLRRFCGFVRLETCERV